MIRPWRLGLAAAGLALASCATEPPPPRTAAVYADHLVGRLANLRLDHAAATDRYFSALSRDPGNETLLNGAVTAALASGDVTRARQATRMAPRTGAPAYAHVIRAVDHLNAGRWRQADADLVAAEGSAAEELVARMTLVWARAAEGRVDDVIVELTPLAAIRPYGSLFGYQQALALDYAGRDADALAAYRNAAAGGMFLPPGVERHADLLVRTGAAAEASTLLNTDTNRVNPALVAALARVEAGQPVSTTRVTPAAGAAVGLYGLAAVFQQERDSTNALAALTIALMLDSSLDAARLMFAQIQSELGHGDLARAALDQITPPSPYAPSARVMQAWVLVDQGREDEALALARAGAEAGDLRSKRALADMYRNLERYGDAEALYSELLEANPRDWRLHFARGAARERLNRWPEAETDMRRALQISPDQPEVLNYLGYMWIDRGEHMQEGLAMIQRAVALRPASGAIIDSLGWAYFKLGDYAQALDYLEQAVQLEPADPTLNEHLGDVYWRLDRRIEARFQWRRALTLDPDNPQAIEAKIENGLPDEPPARSANR